MRSIRTNDDVVPVKDFKAKLSSWLEHVARNRRPLLITQNGRPAGVLLDPRDFDEVQERAAFIQAVQEGLEDAAAGRFVSEEELDRALKIKLRKAEK